MAALVFPSNPSVGDQFEHFRWDGQKWVPANYVTVTGDAPATGVFGRNAHDWRLLEPFERVLSVRMLNDQTIPASVWTTINWDTVDFDLQGGWSNATRQYTPKVAGWYFFVCVTPYIEHFLMTKNAGPGAHTNQVMASRVPGSWFHTDATVTYMNGTTDYVTTSVYSPALSINPGWRNELGGYRIPTW